MPQLVAIDPDSLPFHLEIDHARVLRGEFFECVQMRIRLLAHIVGIRQIAASIYVLADLLVKVAHITVGPRAHDVHIG